LAHVLLDADMEVHMGDIIPTPSRRAFLGGFATTSAVVVVAAPAIEALDREFVTWGDEPIVLARTKQGRSDSEFRYHNAEGFFACLEAGLGHDRHRLLYQTGIVMQLALSAHLLDIGFSDRWCARHIGLRIAKSLGYANATGLGHSNAEIEQLAELLTPYCKWNGWPSRNGSEPKAEQFTHGDICRLTRGLLDHVRNVTGHTLHSPRRSSPEQVERP
jgi:hypothetical protein